LLDLVDETVEAIGVVVVDAETGGRAASRRVAGGVAGEVAVVVGSPSTARADVATILAGS
jgi:hypothetical protein